MAEVPDGSGLTASHFEVTAEGVYINGHKLPATDEITVEHVDPDFHIVSLTLLVSSFRVDDHPRVSESAAATYRYVHDKTGADT